MVLEIKPLSIETLEQAITLANAVFPQDNPEIALRASLDREAYIPFYQEQNLRTLEYWAGLDDKNVIGTIGLFSLDDDYREAAWVGWFCVHPDYKGRGIGKKLLEFAIQEAQQRGNTYLRLSTKTENKDAHRLYQRRGFVDIDQENEGADITFYKQLSLDRS